ncbi:MAG TPA: TetR/AcrR family transcriptional regulator [Steroidobacteraceae bacterium]|nr:TetR/AcrR family transcriptional regulator [Steroidobacteraceae bacterium]
MRNATTAPQSAASREPQRALPVRERILCAAMETFIENGYAGAGTLSIARRARVSKRELYALFGSKQAMLATCIAERAQRMRVPEALPRPRDRQMLAALLTRCGTVLLREICAPEVIAVFRLAILEAPRSPEVARTLDANGRRASRTAILKVLGRARAAGLIGGARLAAMTEQYLALLWGDLFMRVLMRLEEVPSAAALSRRAQRATQAFLQLHPQPLKRS